MLDEAMKEYEAGHHKRAMTEMAEALTLITEARA
jgi:hypothetical protein